MEFRPISELDAQVSPEVLAKAHKLYEQENLGMGLEIIALPNDDNAEREVHRPS
jgi:hypothetical protein